MHRDCSRWFCPQNMAGPNKRASRVCWRIASATCGRLCFQRGHFGGARQLLKFVWEDYTSDLRAPPGHCGHTNRNTRTRRVQTEEYSLLLTAGKKCSDDASGLRCDGDEFQFCVANIFSRFYRQALGRIHSRQFFQSLVASCQSAMKLEFCNHLAT